MSDWSSDVCSSDLRKTATPSWGAVRNRSTSTDTYHTGNRSKPSTSSDAAARMVWRGGVNGPSRRRPARRGLPPDEGRRGGQAMAAGIFTPEVKTTPDLWGGQPRTQLDRPARPEEREGTR